MAAGILRAATSLRETGETMATNERLPAHTPRCFGCGDDNPCGLGLEGWRDGDEVRGRVTFGKHHSGGPMFAHGGAVATALDDCLGMLLYVIQTPAVTARLETDYRKPVLLNTEYGLHAWMTGREGRKMWAAIDMRDADGQVVAEGKGLFLTVTIDHFTKDLPDDWRERAKDMGLDLPW